MYDYVLLYFDTMIKEIDEEYRTTSNNMNFSFILCHLDVPFDFYYPLVWTLTIKKKEA